MDEHTLNNLARTLVADEATGFQQFRHLFFEALERRQFEACRTLVEVLCAAPSVTLQRDCRYHQAVLLSEQRLFDQAEVILRRLLADDLSPQQRARTLLELAIQLDEQGQWSEAEHFYRQALAAYQANQDLSGQARTYNNLGVSICFQVECGENSHERLPEAIDCHRTALELAQAANDQWEVARNWHGLGRAHSLRGDYPAALAAFQQDLTWCQALDDPCDRAVTLSDMAALLYQPQNQWAEALTALDEALAIFRDCHDDLHLAEALTRRGSLLVQLSRFFDALVSFNEALQLSESIRARLAAPTTQAGYRATVEFIYTAPISLHLHQGQADQAFTAAERARSRVLVDLLAGQTAQPHAEISPELLEQRDSLRQALDQAYAQEYDEQSPTAKLAEMEQSLADLDRQIELMDPTYAGLESVDSLTVEQVRNQLPADAALITYVGDTNDQLWVLVVTTDGVQAELIKNVSVRWLQGYLAKRLDGSQYNNLVPETQTGHLSPAHLFPVLFQALLGPIWDTLQAVQTVYIIPYGPLHYLPLGALIPDLTDPPPLLAAGRRVVYAPSATILFNYCHASPASRQQGLMAVAPQDERLQFTQGAAKSIAQRFGGASLVGSAANRQTFLAEAGRFRAICFLGHAVFDQRHPMASRLILDDGSLHASEILRELRLQADLVILSACETGRSRVLRGDEILGLSRALLYAGTPSLLVTLWPVHEIPTCLLVQRLVEQLASPAAGTSPSPDTESKQRFDPALALAASQRWLRDLTYAEAHVILTQWDGLAAVEAASQLTALWQMTHPGDSPRAESRIFAHPFFWSPYILIGDKR
ncbi:MAG: CHAT domain-containing protein [Anaerolineae bacterium]|nr:CHAT domain-containing protein [Anaerolineae bacterium]